MELGSDSRTQGRPSIVLAVFPFDDDRMWMRDTLSLPDWKLHFASTFLETQAALRARAFGAVITEGHLPDGYCWRDILQEVQWMGSAPPVVVADRHADERLWAEVLNLGVYDLLMKPFDAQEVVRVMSMACRRFANEHRMGARKAPNPEKSALSTRTKVRTGHGGA